MTQVTSDSNSCQRKRVTQKDGRKDICKETQATIGFVSGFHETNGDRDFPWFISRTSLRRSDAELGRLGRYGGRLKGQAPKVKRTGK